MTLRHHPQWRNDPRGCHVFLILNELRCHNMLSDEEDSVGDLQSVRVH